MPKIMGWRKKENQHRIKSFVPAAVLWFGLKPEAVLFLRQQYKI